MCSLHRKESARAEQWPAHTITLFTDNVTPYFRAHPGMNAASVNLVQGVSE